MELRLGGLSVFLAMPAYGQLPAETAQSLLASWQAVAQQGLPIQLEITQGSSRVTAARIMAVHAFLKTEANRLFFIDSDMVWKSDDFLRLMALSSEYECVGASYPMRKDPPSFCVMGVIPGQEVETNSFGLMSIDGMGLGFTCIQRKVIEALADKAPLIEMSDPKHTIAREIFTSGSRLVDGKMMDMGEDMRFFADIKELGYKVWMDPTIRLGHVGEKIYYGAFEDVIKEAVMPKDFRAGKGSEWTYIYNNSELQKRSALLHEKLGEVGNDVCIRAPFFCELGENIYLGNNVFLNTNCTLSDVDFIWIGDRTLFGPGVQVYTGYHEKGLYNAYNTLCKPVKIGQRCWIGGNAIILPGVTIGDGAVIGAGSVVTKDVPDNTTVVGNPARPTNDK